MTIYLYVKTHRKTGLKYLGKTKSVHPEKYKGSGKYWVRHLEMNGYDVETTILRECQNNEEVREWGLYYSQLWNVVESDEWANLKEEAGDGGDTSMTAAYREHVERIKIEYKKRRWWNNGQHSAHAEFPPDDTYILGRLQFNNVGAKIGTERQRGKIWINNGTHEMMILPTDNLPEGYTNGRIESPKKNKTNLHITGTKWWNNGTNSTMAKECPGPEWTRGRL